MCTNRRTWIYNLVLVALTLLTVTAPLIQHVSCMANGIPADIIADTVKSLPLTTLTKRDVSNVVAGTGNVETYDGLHVSKNGNGDVDFDAYVNEFNMQDEASIPEDILDQQHIQDEDVQYATESEATDIVFESEGPASRYFTSHGDKKNNNDQSNSNIYKKKYNKTNKSKTYDENPNSEIYISSREEYNDDMAIVGDELATEDEEIVKQNMDMNGGSDAYKKFKRIKAEQNGQHQHKQQQEQQKQQERIQHQHQDPLAAIVKLNERKFNKSPIKEVLPQQKTSTNRKTSKNTEKKIDKVEDNDYKLDKNEEEGGGKEQEDTATIGDIEEKFRNEDEALFTAVDGDEATVTATQVENNYGGHSDNDDDKSFPNTENVERSMSGKEISGQMLTSAIVGKKTKRFNRVRTFNSGDRQEAMLKLDDIHNNPSDHKNMMNGNGKTDKNNKRYQRPEIVAAEKFQNDYAIKNYGIEATTKNGSNIFEDIRNTSGQLLQHNAYAVLTEENAKNGETDAVEQATSHGTENEQRQQIQQEQEQLQLQEQAQHGQSMSAFEQHKAQRRNNRRYGHKSHKKRYKDYLRFAMTPVKTTAITPTTMVPLVTRNTNEQNAILGIETDANTKSLSDSLNNGENAAIEATLAKLTNNSEQNYENKHEVENIENIENIDENLQAERRVKKLRKYATKFDDEKPHESPASPIFVVGNRDSVSAMPAAARVNPTKPFYEGQINYYMETKDDEQTGLEDNSNLQADTVNWYRRVSPVLRNGIKTSLLESNEPPSEHGRKNHHHHLQHLHQNLQQNHHHHHHHHHHQMHHQKHHQQQKHQQEQQHQHQHHAHRKHQQTNKHYQSAQSNPYQRKLVRQPSSLGSSIVSSLYSTPIPPPSYKPHAGAMKELGHQITEMEELERYYAKWPHLARVQLQVYDEHFRELHPELYTDYDQDYESAAELEEAQNGNSEDANLPPYIKKYNRRNKQLLNLLEGTLAPQTKAAVFRQGHFSSLLQPGPHESSSRSSSVTVRIDDDYMKEKRRRYHNRYGNNNSQHNGFQYDLFAQQRAIANANNSLTTKQQQQNSTEFDVVEQKPKTLTTTATLQNKIPGEDVSITRDEQDDPDWQQEIETKSNGNVGEMTGNAQMTWQIEKLTTLSTPTHSPSPKPALFRLPSYPAISGNYIGKPRSRSAQFAPSGSSSINGRGNAFINMHRDYHNFEKTRHMATAALTTVAPESIVSESSTITSPSSKTINSFVYHRVVDSAPRFVGAGATGLKQRLPFVAITDRRLETAKKTLMEHKQDFEQNFYPMP